MVTFPVNLGQLVVPSDSPDKGFHEPDALPDANQQKHTGLHLFCIHYNS